MSDIAATERERLDQLEAVIERGARMFIEAGIALAEIRDSRLYRDSHATFESYCLDRWQMSRPHAYRLIDAATVANAVSPTGDSPATESVARELAPLREQPDAMRDAWAEVVEEFGPKPTAEQVREVVRVPPDPFVDDDDARVPDTRFELLEQMVAVAKMLPPPSRMVWPKDAGDLEAADESLTFLSQWLPAVKASRRSHRRRTRERATRLRLAANGTR
jgi:hypothetical protein